MNEKRWLMEVRDANGLTVFAFAFDKELYCEDAQTVADNTAAFIQGATGEAMDVTMTCTCCGTMLDANVQAGENWTTYEWNRRAWTGEGWEARLTQPDSDLYTIAVDFRDGDEAMRQYACSWSRWPLALYYICLLEDGSDLLFVPDYKGEPICWANAKVIEP